MLTAFEAVEPAAGSVKLVVSPDEETTQRGLADYLEAEGVDADAAVVGEPSGLDVCPSARGHYDLEITFHGESAHGATPESGLNATACLAEAVKRLESVPHLHDDELGSNSYTPTIAQAGNLPNQVPEAATLVVDYRTLPVESLADAMETVSDALAGLACEYEVSFYEAGSSLGSYRTDRDEAIVTDLADCVESVTGEQPALEPFPAATEAAFFAEHAPTVVFGPGLIADDGEAIAHSEREYVPVQEVADAAESLTLLLDRWLAQS
jgi:acetylornithine deacetylase/succinyl-diaminopimelate desuccinylase-like protein